jgi:DNA-binding SARP family transcriptional activator
MVLEVPLEELAPAFAGRPDLAGLWQRLQAGGRDFSLPDEILLTLAESRAHEKAGRIAPALARAERAYEIARQAGDAPGLAGSLSQRANIHFRLGHYAESVRLARDALTRVDRHPEGVTARMLLGLCASETYDWDEAEARFREAADISREIGYPAGLALALLNLGVLGLNRGHFELALASLAESAALNEAAGLPNWWPLLNLGAVYQTIAERERARDALDALGRIATPGSLPHALHQALTAQLALDEDNLEQAETALATARRQSEVLGSPLLALYARLAMSRLRRLQADAPAALAWAEEALALSRRVGNRFYEAQAQVQVARARWALDQPSAAAADLSAALTSAEALGAAYLAAEIALLLAALKHEQAWEDAASAWLEAAERLKRGGYGFILERERSLAFPLVAAHARHADPTVRKAAEAGLELLAQVAPLPLRVAGLGAFAVWQGRRRIPDREWKRRKAGELFRWLLLQRGHRADRERALDALWPDQPADQAQPQLYQATSALRHLLEPDLPVKFPSRYLIFEGQQIELRVPPGSWVDFEQFEQALRGVARAAAGQPVPEAERPAVAAALELYHDDLFPEDRYAAWAAAPRERLTELRRRGQLALAAGWLSAGEAQAALGACREVLVDDAWNEEAVLLGMRACLALHDRPAALRLYRDLEAALRLELGLAPRPDLRALAESLANP